MVTAPETQEAAAPEGEAAPEDAPEGAGNEEDGDAPAPDVT
jgi:hypothetical protein